MTTGLNRLRHLFWDDASKHGVGDGLDPDAHPSGPVWPRDGGDDAEAPAAPTDGRPISTLLQSTKVVDLLNAKNDEFEQKVLHRDCDPQ